MANQITINIGAAANDGTGDPLRTAFNEVNLNFANVWATGLPNSNVRFNNNRILTVNTNANLVLAPNGTGIVQSNVSILPNIDRVHNLGSDVKKWDSVYAHYMSINSLDIGADLTVTGNLTVEGDTIQIGNIVTDTKTIQLANTAGTANAANGSGITVGANDNIATLLYNSTSNIWATNIGISAVGNITASYFVGNGSLLTGIASYGNANVDAYLPIYSGNISAAYINVANNVNAINDVYAKRGTFSGDPVTGDASLYIGSPTFTDLGSDVMAQFTGNVTNYAQINLQNYGNSPTSSGDYIITADNGTDATHFLDLGLTGSNWDGTQPNSLGNRLGPNDGYLYVQDGDFVIGTSNGTIETWKFDQSGNLILSSEGKVVGATPNNNGYLQWVGNSSGDGAGYTTLGLVPDDTLVGNDQYLIIDPTAPGHIHIRAGGTQDASNADLFLGGEYTHFKVNAGANSEARISANSYSWVFGTDSTLTVPNEGIIRSIQDTVILQSVDVYGNTYSARLGTTGGLYLETTDYPSGWLYLTNDSGNANINAPSGNINITSELSVTGNITGNTAGFAIGYRDIPQVIFSANTTATLADAGKHYYSTESTDYILTIDNNSNVAWPVGAAITIVNRGTGNITIAEGTGVDLYLAGNSTAGARTISTYGMASLLNVAANVWMINGTGVA